MKQFHFSSSVCTVSSWQMSFFCFTCLLNEVTLRSRFNNSVIATWNSRAWLQGWEKGVAATNAAKSNTVLKSLFPFVTLSLDIVQHPTFALFLPLCPHFTTSHSVSACCIQRGSTLHCIVMKCRYLLFVKNEPEISLHCYIIKILKQYTRYM